jgi:tetratricopeptide (TPR) repeat protein
VPLDWYRRTEWSPEVERDFFARLKRSRRHNRAQYLRVQAVHLIDAGGADRFRKALELLERLIREYDAPTELAQAQALRGSALIGLGDTQGAIEALRSSFAAQRAFPTVQTMAYLQFGMLAVQHNRPELYREALSALDEFAGFELELFPIQEYQAAVIRAVALDALGAHEEARSQANRALDAARKKETPLRYHRQLGLVVVEDRALHERVVRLARSRS